MTGRTLAIAAVALAFVALALAWRFTALADMLDLGRMVDSARALREWPLSPLIVIAAYVIGGLIVAPLTLLIITTSIVFGPWLGIAYAYAGAMASAAATYAVGHLLGRETLRHLAGGRLDRLTQRLAKKGIAAIVVVRNVPVAPYSIVNLVAGAAGFPLRDFLIGTFIGLTPGLILLCVFVDRLEATLRNPEAKTIALLAAIVIALVGVTVVAQRWLGRRDSLSDDGADA